MEGAWIWLIIVLAALWYVRRPLSRALSAILRAGWKTVLFIVPIGLFLWGLSDIPVFIELFGAPVVLAFISLWCAWWLIRRLRR